MGVNIDVLGPALAAAGVTARPSDTRVLGALDTWFKDCTDDVTDDGTAHEAAYHNSVLANLRSVIRGNGLTAGGNDIVALDNADDMIWRACQHLYQRNQPRYADDTGVADSIIMALTPAPAEIKEGMRISTKIQANNTGGACTLTLNATVKNVKTVTGANPTKGMLIAGQHATFEYDGTNWQLVSVLPETMSFVPMATFDLAAVASIPHATYTNSPVSLTGHANFSSAPVINGGGTSFSLPAGQYLLVGNLVQRIVVSSITQAAIIAGIYKNGALVESSSEFTHFLAGQDGTFNNIIAHFVTSSGIGDLFQIVGYTACTSGAHFSLGQILSGSKFRAIRIGN